MRAACAGSTIAVCQAYPQEIAEPAVRARTFVAPFKRERMTWALLSYRQSSDEARMV
ncbi:DUF4291 family protein [Streptomyces sp. NPDC048254]|uniref:DUF4291 family protein n=1 Tax=Streptomyces sp. NPDC048254 TaxID=3365525 RepID=UPI00371EDFF4